MNDIRLIDANALMEYCSNQKTKTISNNDIARFPTADAVSREDYDKMKKIAKSWQDEFRNASEIANKLSADRPTGEWICKGDYAVCSKCGGSSGTQFDGVEPIPRITTYCPHCGVRMKGGDSE